VSGARRPLAALIGVLFGFTLCWTGMSDPDVIRDALLFHEAYLFLFFASAVLTATVGLRLLRAVRGTTWCTERPQRRHVVGSVVFGVGWGVTNACPGPVATQIGMGILWSVPLAAGVVLGVRLFLRGAEESEPATDDTGVQALGRPATDP
jgi:uncharacterized membrane protein YedE/YeeE